METCRVGHRAGVCKARAGSSTGRRTIIRCTANAPPTATGSTSGSVSASAKPRTASEAALAYYDNYNAKRMDKVLELIAEDCVYEDLIYEDPFVGRAAIAAYYKKIETLVPPDIVFVVEDITQGDDRKAGVRWHVELDGIQFPFSRGVSFYEVNEQGQIVFARDIVEPSLKPGGLALKGISIVAPLVRKLGPAASPASLKRLPLAAGAMWAAYAAYIGVVMFSTWAPGLPVWQTTPEALAVVFHQSLNFFYVNIGLDALGLAPVPCISEHPVSEAIFNFMNAWSLLFLPAMMADPRLRRVNSKLALWVGIMFLTNVFAFPAMALRLQPQPEEAVATSVTSTGIGADGGSSAASPALARSFGAVSLAVAVFSLGWAVAARPEYGGLDMRLEYLHTLLTTSRIDWAFAVDACFYSVWQWVLLGAAGAPAWQRALPMFGMAAWSLGGGQPRRQDEI